MPNFRVAVLALVLAGCAESEVAPSMSPDAQTPDAQTPDAGAEPDASDGLGGLARPPCAGPERVACDEGFTCMFTLIASACGADDATGECWPTPRQCELAAPVCGCDAETYENECAASAAGIALQHYGACEEEEPDCILDSVVCRLEPLECDEGQVHTQEGSCYGPCVPLGECRCAGSASCPLPDSHACNDEGRCELRAE